MPQRRIKSQPLQMSFKGWYETPHQGLLCSEVDLPSSIIFLRSMTLFTHILNNKQMRLLSCLHASYNKNFFGDMLVAMIRNIYGSNVLPLSYFED